MTDAPTESSESRLQRLDQWLAQHSLWVALCALLIAWPLNITRSPFAAAQRYHEDSNLVDDSWYLELPYRLSYGDWAGRDFVFTYGPLFQWVHGLGGFIPGGTEADIVRFSGVLDATLGLLALWGLLALTRSPLRWRLPLFFGAILTWDFIIKPWVGLAAVVATVYALSLHDQSPDGQPINRRAKTLAWCSAASLSPIIMLYSFDLGIFSFLALNTSLWLLSLGTLKTSSEAIAQQRKHWLMASGLSIAGLLLFILGLSLTPFHNFVGDSWRIAQGYSVTMAMGFMRRKYVTWMLLAFFAGVALFLGGMAALRKIIADPEARSQWAPLVAFLTLLVFATAWLRYGLTRSDKSHVVAALLPLCLAITCVLPALLEQHLKQRRWLLAVIVILGLAATVKVRKALDKKFWRQPLKQLAAITDLSLRAAYFELDHDSLKAAKAITDGDAPDSPLYVWPFQSVTNLILKRRSPSYALQSYTSAKDPRIELKTVAALKKSKDLRVLILRPSMAIDNIEHHSRAPAIYEHLLRHCQLAKAPSKHALLLKQGPERAWQSRTLKLEPQSLKPGETSLTLDLRAESVRASDILKLTIKTAKSRRLAVRKPGRLHLVLNLSDGSKVERTLISRPDNQSHSVIVKAISPEWELFYSDFCQSRGWRSIDTIQSLSLTWVPLDKLSATPASLDLTAVTVMHRASGELRETSLKQARDPQLVRWCFGQ